MPSFHTKRSGRPYITVEKSFGVRTRQITDEGMDWIRGKFPADQYPKWDDIPLDLDVYGQLCKRNFIHTKGSRRQASRNYQIAHNYKVNPKDKENYYFVNPQSEERQIARRLGPVNNTMPHNPVSVLPNPVPPAITPQVVVCRKCSNHLPTSAGFCPRCGQGVNASIPSATKPTERHRGWIAVAVVSVVLALAVISLVVLWCIYNGHLTITGNVHSPGAGTQNPPKLEDQVNSFYANLPKAAPAPKGDIFDQMWNKVHAPQTAAHTQTGPSGPGGVWTADDMAKLAQQYAPATAMLKIPAGDATARHDAKYDIFDQLYAQDQAKEPWANDPIIQSNSAPPKPQGDMVDQHFAKQPKAADELNQNQTDYSRQPNKGWQPVGQGAYVSDSQNPNPSPFALAKANNH